VGTPGRDFLTGVRDGRRMKRQGGDGYWGKQVSWMHPRCGYD
jgi:hypothetical protein